MILVTGGCGVMGSVLVRDLAQAGHAVRVLTLPGDPGAERVRGYAADIRYGDIANADDCKGICDDVDTVYHLAAVIIAFDDTLYRRINVEGTRNCVNEAKRAGVGHFIYVSSASVTYPKQTPYSQSKRDAEDIVAGSGLPYTIVRPTLVYDKGRGGQEFDLFLEYLRKFPVIPFIGNGRAIKRPVFVDDITGGLLGIYGKDTAKGRTYNFSGAEAIAMIDFARLCLRLLGRKHAPILHVPVWLCRIMAWIMKNIMPRPPLRDAVIAGIIRDADLDPAEAMADLGYRPSKVSERLVECFPRR